MRTRIYIGLTLLLLVAFLFARFCLFTVDRADFVYLTQFGRPVATFDGAASDEAGLHLKWPWPIQSVQRFDRRLQYLDLPGAELLTRDAKRDTIDKTLTIDAYLCWRIPDKEALDQFIRTLGTQEGARDILRQRFNSEIGAAIGQMELDDLISVGVGSELPDVASSVVSLLASPLDGPLLAATVLGGIRPKVERKRDELRERLLSGSPHLSTPSLQESVLKEYGVEVVDLRLRRLNHPAGTIRQAIFERIISEREKKVADYQSEGERLASDIRSNSERRVTELRAAAQAEATRLSGEADAAADRIRNEAARQDPAFYAFLRNLEDYQRILGDNKTMLLLSSQHEMFNSLLKPPAPGKTEPTPTSKGDK